MTKVGQRHRGRPTGSTWSRRGVLAAAAVAGTGTLTGGLSGCSSGGSGSEDKLKKKINHPSDNFNKKGFPIVKDPVSVKFMTNKPPRTAKDYNKVASWVKYQKLTNINVSWGLVPAESIEEKRNLALSSGDYPEVFYANNFSIRDVSKYGKQGVFIRLNELIDEYMPNLKRLLKKNSDIERGLTFPDGNIYGFPWAVDPDFTAFRISHKPWVRGDWLDKFDMDVPATTDEYYQYLKMVKTKAPNGRGDTVGYCAILSGVGLYRSLRGSFGIGNRGAIIPDTLDTEPADEEKVRFFPVTDGYKALLEYLHKLYSDGLIAKNIFSIDETKAYHQMSQGAYGSTVDIAPYDLVGGKAKNFVPMPALKGPDGHHTYNNVSPLLKGVYCAITDKCEHPVEMARWVDYFYSGEGAKLFFMGVEGESYKETKNGVEYLDKIRHPKNGLSEEEARKPYVTYMGSGSAVLEIEDYFKGAENTEEARAGVKLLNPDSQSVLKNAWPESGFTFTEDEFQKLESMADDIEKYVGETRDKFISGDVKLSSWDKYVEKIKKMGLDDYLEIQQAAYDRYRKD